MRAAERKAALDSGLTTYSTGRPCPKGHMAPRKVNSGGCVACAQEGTQRWRARNVAHLREYASMRYSADPEGRRAKVAGWRAANPEKVAAYDVQRYAENRDRERQRCAAYYVKTAPQRRAYSLQFRIDNIEKVDLCTKRWRAEHPEQVRAQKNARRSREKGAEGVFSGADIRRLFTAQKGRCAGDRRHSLRGGYHIDHIKPLALGGSNWPRNLQLLCPSCNCRKGAKDPVEWAQTLGMLL